MDDVLSSKLNKWPDDKPFDTIKVIFSTEKYGIKEIEVWISKNDGVVNAFPIKGSQVFKWFNGK
ncbi:hypothetical protein METP2_02348 [Methanosarcinales archaeon]|nr:hypothetical protein [Candidatus Methanoperedens sp.]CAG0987269.1 hypothetical protein METP2_02348 [Methanosarcinales archaeon]